MVDMRCLHPKRGEVLFVKFSNYIFNCFLYEDWTCNMRITATVIYLIIYYRDPYIKGINGTSPICEGAQQTLNFNVCAFRS